MFTRFMHKTNGVNGETLVPHRECTAEDLERFAEPASDAQGLLQKYRENPKRILYCPDWDKIDDDFAIWGSTDDEISYQRFEFLLVPCNYLHAEFGPTGDTIAKECIADREAQMEYLTNMRVIYYTDIESFN
mmetsp:Transcript_43029/g.56948  ORF Transcript_43029/g.56948 Transcript_43029/m.56948 type:complete len:132 (+) Transcript_43029:358-753(+)